MPARILVAFAALATTGLALWSRGGSPDPLLPRPVVPHPVAPVPPLPPVVPDLGGHLLPATAVPQPAIPATNLEVPSLPGSRGRDPLLELNDRAGIDDLMKQLRQVREKKDELERFERQLVSKLQEKVRQQAEKLKELGVVEAGVVIDPK